MKRGIDPAVMLDTKGRIFAIGTGTDAVAEHEMGALPLMNSLVRTPGRSVNEWASWLIKAHPSAVADAVATGDQSKLAALLPSLYETKRIARIAQVYYQEKPQGNQLHAAFWYTDALSFDPFTHRELQPRESELAQGYGSAWNRSGFAFKAYGDKAVRRLRDFANRCQKGEGFFAGTILPHPGVVIACETLLRTEHRQAMQDKHAAHLETVLCVLKAEVLKAQLA